MDILKLKPVIKDYIWGGERLRTDFGFDSEYDRLAEGWMLSCHKDGMNTIEGGDYDGFTLNQIIEKFGKESVIGKKSIDFPYFPVLVKLIDARDNLSIQVHPDNEYAQRVEGEYGKTEIWYVLDATDDAKIVYGFKNEISAEQFKDAIENNTLLEELNVVNAKKGDLFFIEAGTVHAIGKGTLIAEIQQNSNTTYRVYDYGRVGADGKPRELHIQKAIDVSVTKPPKYEIKPMGKPVDKGDYIEVLLTKCDLFTVWHYDVREKVTLCADEQSFNHILVVNGCGEINGRKMKKGDSFFVPADFGEYEIKGKCEIITTNI